MVGDFPNIFEMFMVKLMEGSDPYALRYLDQPK